MTLHDRYTMLARLHESSETVIHRALRIEDRLPVIVKAPRGEYPTPRALARLRHEYDLLQGLALPGVIRVHALEPSGHHLALIEEDFGGQPLDQRIREARLDRAEVLRIAVAVAGTLEALHALPIVHRDIKPHRRVPARPRRHRRRAAPAATPVRTRGRDTGVAGRADPGAPRGGRAGIALGAGGVGKSALVQEAFKGLAQREASFVAGKFDQLARHVPYAPIAQALRQLMRELLTEPPDELERRRRALQSALGGNGQLLVNLVPELGLVIGPQPEPPELGPTETRNRFALAFQNFFRVVAAVDHPLVLALDDLQWADPASLTLLEILLTDPDAGRLLIVAAYRDQDTAGVHPLRATLEELRRAGVPITELALQPLGSAPGEAVAVAIASSTVPGIDVLRFDAAGSLLDRTRPLATGAVRTLTSADLEGDGDAALVVLTRNDDDSSSLAIVPRLADGWGPSRTRSLANVHTTSAPDRPLQGPVLVVGDIDLDDRVDAVVMASGAVVHLRDIGADDPPAPQIHEDPRFDDPDALALADIDGEGPLDLVTCSSAGLEIILLAADGEPQPQASPDQYVTRCALHVDPQDGRATAALVSDRGYSLLRPDFAPALARTDGFQGGPGYFKRLATGDIDADGTADIVVADEPSPSPVGSTAVLWGEANGEPGRATWQAGELFQTAEIAVAPLDDRPGDEVVIAWTQGVTQIWTHDDGALQKTFTTQAALAYDVLGVGVQRRAGAPSDVILLSRTTADLGLFALPRGEDGDFIAGADVLLWTGPWIDAEATMTIADFDGDGYEDIAVLHGALEGVAVTWGAGGRAPSVTTVPIPVFAQTSLASADLDGDGTAELVVGTEQGVVRIGFTDREPTPRQTLLTGPADRGLLLADLDADGTTDVVGADDNWLRISLRSPAGDYFQRLAMFVASWQLRAADIDGDQLLDLVGLFGGTVITRRSTGSPPPPE